MKKNREDAIKKAINILQNIVEGNMMLRAEGVVWHDYSMLKYAVENGEKRL